VNDPIALALLERCYEILGNTVHQWPGRAENQVLLSALLHYICVATEREHQEAQDDYCSRIIERKLATGMTKEDVLKYYRHG
jgi:hypothetical protein